MSTLEADVAALRAFNRLYTRRLGLLKTHVRGSPFTLSEARVLYEVATRTDPTAAQIARELGLDRAQISRTLKRFVARGLITARPSELHGRLQLLTITDEGAAASAELQSASTDAMRALLSPLSEEGRSRFMHALSVFTRVLD